MGAIALAWSEFPAATAAQLRWAFTYAHAGRRSTVTPPFAGCVGGLPCQRNETPRFAADFDGADVLWRGDREPGRLLMEVVEAVSDVWGQDRVGVRLSPLGTFNDMVIHRRSKW